MRIILLINMLFVCNIVCNSQNDTVQIIKKINDSTYCVIKHNPEQTCKKREKHNCRGFKPIYMSDDSLNVIKISWVSNDVSISKYKFNCKIKFLGIATKEIDKVNIQWMLINSIYNIKDTLYLYNHKCNFNNEAIDLNCITHSEVNEMKITKLVIQYKNKEYKTDVFNNIEINDYFDDYSFENSEIYFDMKHIERLLKNTTINKY